MTEKLTGLIAAPFTPFKEKGEINFAMIPQQVEKLLEDGIRGAYVCGSTGEGISCSVEERLEMMRLWKKSAGERMKLIAHAGALSLTDVKRLVQAASDLGYDGFSVIPPTFFRPSNEESLCAYCAEIAAYAPRLPFYYYHTMNARLPLEMSKFLEIAAERIPNLAGIKFNCHNLYDYQNCLNFKDGKFDIVFGVDEFFAGALSLGAQGFIGSTYNYYAPVYRRIYQAYQAGEWSTVRQGMKCVCEMVKLLNRFGGISAGKAMMQLRGMDFGPTRLPLKPLALEERPKIANLARELFDSFMEK